MTLLATVFNLDDTLVDSAGTWHQVISAVAARSDRCADGMVDAIARGTFGLQPGAAELVALAAELGPVGLVSAAPRRYVRAAASASGILRHVQVIVSGEEVANGKPSPDPYLVAARKLGLKPGQCLAVEDSGPGIRSAHAAGMTVLAISSASIEALDLAAQRAADAKLAAKAMCQLWVEVYALSR